jgi:hypothetical protein
MTKADTYRRRPTDDKSVPQDIASELLARQLRVISN